MPHDPWFVEVYTSREQKAPQTFSHTTEMGLRNKIHDYLLSTRPTYLKSGTNTLWKQGQLWNLSGGALSNREQDEHVYRTFCDNHLAIHLEPREQEKRNIQKRASKARPQVTSCLSTLLYLWVGMLCFALLSFVMVKYSFSSTFWLVLFIISIALFAPLMLLKAYNTETEQQLYKWLKTYGIQTLATVKDHVKEERSDSRIYKIKYVWSNPKMDENYSLWWITTGNVYEASPLGSTYPIILDPQDATTFQIFQRGQSQPFVGAIFGMAYQGQSIHIHKEL